MNPEKWQILESRAEALARPLDHETDGAAGRFDAVQFSLAGETYAVAAEFVREVAPLKDFSPIPCTPPFILGMMNLRGEILTVLNLGRLFDLTHTPLSDLNRVLVLRGGGQEFGLLADAIIGVRSLRIAELQPLLPTLDGIRAELFRGVTTDRLIVLDTPRLLSHEMLIVRDEAPAH